MPAYLSTSQYQEIARWAVWRSTVPSKYHDDAIGAAYEGIAVAVSSYKPDQGASLTTWAQLRALHHIQESVRLWFHTRRTITDFDVECCDLFDDIPRPLREEIEYEEIVNRIVVEDALVDLTDREFDIVRRYFFDEDSLSVIGRDYKVTESRVSQIKLRALDKLRDAVSA